MQSYLIVLFFQLTRFGIVGLTAATLHFCLVVGMVSLFEIQPLIANIFAFFISFQVSYWGHYLWTFKAVDIPHRNAAPKLLFLQIFNIGLGELIFYTLLRFNLPYQIALIFMLLILPIFTFLFSKTWVFKKAPSL